MPDKKSSRTPPTRDRLTYVLYDRATGAIVGVHQVAHPAGHDGARAPDHDKVLARLAAAHARAPHEFAALEAPGLATGEAGHWRVDVVGKRLVRGHASTAAGGAAVALRAP